MTEESSQQTLIRPAITAAPFLVTGRLLDRVPEVGSPFGLAFSIRRVYTGYTGPALRVRRASDGAERDIGFVQTALDVDDLERHCAGFDGFVTVWYDQTGQNRHARQSVWNLQPQIVQQGSAVRDKLGNLAVEFNGAFLTTEWEPKETEVGEATGLMTVASSGIGIQGQTGQIELKKKDEEQVSEFEFPDYPNDTLPVGLDRLLLETTVVPDDSEENPKRIMVYRGKDKRLHVFDADEEEVVNLNVETASGPTFITANDVADETLTDDAKRGNAPLGTRAWRHAVEGADGKIYGIPARANQILVIDPRTPEEIDSENPPASQVSYLALPSGVNTNSTDEKWFMGILSSKTKCIVCPPYNQVDQNNNACFLIIDTDEERSTYQGCKLFAQFGNVNELCRDMVETDNGDMFLIPFRDTQIRRVKLNDISTYDEITDPETRILSRTISGRDSGNQITSNLNGLFASGALAPNGKLYCTPWNIGTFLVVDTAHFEDGNANMFDVIGDLGLRAAIRNWGWEGSPNFYNRPRLTYTGDGYVVEDGTESREISVLLDPPDFGSQSSETLTALIRAGRIATNVTVGNQGDGYLTAPSLRVREGSTTSISSASFAIEMENAPDGVGRRIKQINVVNGGRGYRGGRPNIELRGGKGRAAVLRALFDRDDPRGSLFGINIDQPGSGYFKPYIDDARIEISAPGSGQTATAEIDPNNGWVLVDENDPLQGYQLNQVNLINLGTNYTRAPIVRLVTNDRPLQGYTASASVNASDMSFDNHVNSISITDSGSGYETTDPNNRGSTCRIVAEDVLADGTRVFWGGERFVADITEVDSNGAITEINIVNAGRGYNQAPNLIVVDAPGNASGAVLTPTMKRHGMITNITQPGVTSGYLSPPGFGDVSDQLKPGGSNRTVQFITQFLPPTVGEVRTNEKWNQTAYSNADDGYITGVPAGERRVFRIANVQDPSVTPTFTIADISGVVNFRFKYLAGTFDASGREFFCAPFEERRILRVSLNTMDASGQGVGFVGPRVRGRYSCVQRSERNAIYCFPSETQDVLIIDPFSPVASEEMQFGNLRSNGRKFSSCAMITNEKSGWPKGLIYAVPDQTPFVLELNPGISLPRTPDLAPPNVLITLKDPENGTPGVRALLFAPSPETPDPFAQMVIVDPQNPLDRINIHIRVDQDGQNDKNPWFIQGVFCPNAEKGKVVFVPFYNVNSEYAWQNQNKALIFDVQQIFNKWNDGTFDDPHQVYTWEMNETGDMYEWGLEIPLVFRPPYPSRTLVSFQDSNGVSTTVGWVPYGGGVDESLSQEPFVTYRFSGPVSERGLRTKMGPFGGTPDANNPQKRIPERVTWATANILDPNNDEERLVAMTYPIPRFTELVDQPTHDGGDVRFRHAKAVVVDDIVYAAPQRKNTMLRYDINQPENDRRQLVAFPDELDPLFDASKFTDTIYVPLRRELYFIPYDAPWFMVYELDAIGNTKHYTFGELDLLPSKLPGLGQDIELDEDDGDQVQPERALFSCAVLTPDSKILCIPENGTKAVLVNPLQDNFLERVETYIDIPEPGVDWDPESESESGSGSEESLNWGRNMYRYAIVLRGNVYCVPSGARQILKIDLSTNTASFVGDVLPPGGSKWGQPALHPDGNVYCAPDQTDRILKFWLDENDAIQWDLLEIDVGRTNGLFEGAVVGDDGYVYFTPRRFARNSLGFDPVTRETFVFGQYPYQGDFEHRNRQSNAVKLTDGRILAMPISFRNFIEIFPNANEFRTYRLGSDPNAFTNRRWYTEPLFTQRDFRLQPIRSFRSFIGEITPTPLLVFHTDDGYAIYDVGDDDQDEPRAPSLVLSPNVSNGITGYFRKERDQTMVTASYRANDESSDQYSLTIVNFLRGVIAGLRASVVGNGEPAENHLYAAINVDDYEFYVGDGSLTIRGLFGIIYKDGETGVYSGFARGGFDNQGPATGQVAGFIRGLSVGQQPYRWNGNASGGSTFQLGRVDEFDPGTNENTFTAQFSGKLQELVVFQSNQLSRVRTLAENQTFAYNV